MPAMLDPSSTGDSAPGLARRQAAFGCSREEIELLLKPMIADAHEAVGSMGDDTPPAVLSARSRLLFDFFRQRFAQVTNPPIDPYRELSAMSLRTLIGAHVRPLRPRRPPRSAADPSDGSADRRRNA